MTINSKIVNGFILIGGLVMMYIVFPILFLSMPLFIIITAYFIWKRSKLIWPFVILQPLIVITLIITFKTIIKYSDGKAYFWSYGGNLIGLSESFFYYDSTYRVPVFPTDVITNYDPYIFYPTNVSTKLLIKTLGYQKGSYVGEWPSRQHALQYFKKSNKEIPFKKVKNEYTFTIDQKETTLINFFGNFDKSDSLFIANYNDSDCYLISFDDPDSLKTIILYYLEKSDVLAIYNY